MKTFVKENIADRLGLLQFGIDYGWGNGYVVIPKGHPLHGMDYMDIHRLIPNLKVNGGLTFSKSADFLGWDELPEGSEGQWVVGFDTKHGWDTLEMWSKERVMEEAEKLKKQLIEHCDNAY